MTLGEIDVGTSSLLQRAAEGDADAARQLVDEVGPVVFGFVMVRVGGDRGVADDLVQDTFVEALRSASSFRSEAAVSTWMCAIARRRVARWYEAERRREAAFDDPDWPEFGDVDVDHERLVDERDAVVRALGALPPLHRQVLVLKYLDELPVAAIAAELGCGMVRVQSLLQRARVGLRRQLEGQR